MQHFFNEQTKTRIKTFVFDSAKNFHTRYKGFLIKYRQEVFLREIVKISTLGIITLIGFWFYLFFINIASTRGYFLKIAQDQLNSNRAKSDIIKLEVVKEKKKNRDNLRKLYYDGFHVCTDFYGQRRENDAECMFCDELLFRE